MMQHQSAQHCVEVFIRKRQPFDNSVGEGHVHASLACLLPCPADHFGRRIDSVHAAEGPGAPFRRNRQRSGAAANIQHRLAGLEAGEPHQPVAKSTLPAKQKEPSQKVVAGGRVEDSALGARRRVAIPRLRHIALADAR
jgi:hypothetical protein